MPFQFFDSEKSEKFCCFLLLYSKFCTSLSKWLCTFLQSFYQTHQIILLGLYLAMTLHILFLTSHMFCQVLLWPALYLIYFQHTKYSCALFMDLYHNPCLFNRFLLYLLHLTSFYLYFYYAKALKLIPMNWVPFWWIFIDIFINFLYIWCPCMLPPTLSTSIYSITYYSWINSTKNTVFCITVYHFFIKNEVIFKLLFNKYQTYIYWISHVNHWKIIFYTKLHLI